MHIALSHALSPLPSSHLSILPPAPCHQGIPLGECSGYLVPPSPASQAHFPWSPPFTHSSLSPGSRISPQISPGRLQKQDCVEVKRTSVLSSEGQRQFPPCHTAHLQLIDKVDKCQKMDGPDDKCRAQWAASIKASLSLGASQPTCRLDLLLFNYLPETNSLKRTLLSPIPELNSFLKHTDLLKMFLHWPPALCFLSSHNPSITGFQTCMYQEAKDLSSE